MHLSLTSSIAVTECIPTKLIGLMLWNKCKDSIICFPKSNINEVFTNNKFVVKPIEVQNTRNLLISLHPMLSHLNRLPS